MLMASKQAVPVSLCEVLRQIFCHHDRRSLDRDYQNRYSALAAFYTMIHAPASTTMEEIFIRATSLSIASPIPAVSAFEKSDFLLEGPTSWKLASICIRL
jgi:hypothetical protein